MNVFDRMDDEGAAEVVVLMHQTDASDGGNSVRLIGLFETKSNALAFADGARHGYSGTLIVRSRRTEWNGQCVSCGHSYVDSETQAGCHGDCTCLSCNAQRQSEERLAQESYENEYGEGA